ncbi:pentapeptide repeat-containing protein [Cohnella rhizosphaerae]|uniref:pentapeptide repeat-containing protein n=1 Tax=Cohnella rhizosphaerae TaxID=1457232 RepID=UPI003B8A6E01
MRLEQARLEQARLEQARLEQARLEQARLEQARLEQARLEQARLEQARLEQARLEQAQRRQAQLGHLRPQPLVPRMPSPPARTRRNAKRRLPVRDAPAISMLPVPKRRPATRRLSGACWCFSKCRCFST